MTVISSILVLNFSIELGLESNESGVDPEDFFKHEIVDAITGSTLVWTSVLNENGIPLIVKSVKTTI